MRACAGTAGAQHPAQPLGNAPLEMPRWRNPLEMLQRLRAPFLSLLGALCIAGFGAAAGGRALLVPYNRPITYEAQQAQLCVSQPASMSKELKLLALSTAAQSYPSKKSCFT